jgi:hypothetical protein
MIDVNNKSVESLANRIVHFIQDRFDMDHRNIFQSSTE